MLGTGHRTWHIALAVDSYLHYALCAISYAQELERRRPCEVTFVGFEGGEQAGKGAPPVALQLLFARYK